MTSLLPPNLLKLFAPRPPVPYLKPLVKDDAKRGPNKMTGVGPLITRLRTEADEEEIQQGMRDEAAAANGEQSEGTKMEKTDPVEAEAKAQETNKESATTQPPPRAAGSKKKDPIKEAGIVGQEAVKMRREARRKRQEEYKKTSEANYKPQEDPEAIGDPYKTLFISRLSKKTTELDLRREFEMYGAIERIRIVQDRKGKSRSFAFIVYERERDMKAAYKDAEGIPIHHKRILVDVERGRTVKGWKPQKLGGGLGGRPKPVEKTEMAPPPAFGGGGGFRGGFRGGPPRGGGGGFRGGPPGGGGFRGGGPPGGGGFRGGGFGGRGGFGGGGGGPPGGGGGFQGAGAGDRGYGDRGGFGGGAPRGGGFGGGGYGGGPPGGYGGGGGGPPQSNGYQSGPPGGGYGGGGGAGGYKRDFDGGAGGGGGYGGGAYGGGPPPSGGGYDDRDPKRMRY